MEFLQKYNMCDDGLRLTCAELVRRLFRLATHLLGEEKHLHPLAVLRTLDGAARHGLVELLLPPTFCDRDLLDNTLN